jgi:hypothetical protein
MNSFGGNLLKWRAKRKMSRREPISFCHLPIAR